MSPGHQIYIGTSGWVYKEWANDFYHGLKPNEYFQHYATQFPTVEINATFYHLPALSTVHAWYMTKHHVISFLPSRAAVISPTSNGSII